MNSSMASKEAGMKPLQFSDELASRDGSITSNGKDQSNWEWRVKYERLFEAHRKLQKTNNSLEDKLLRIVDKFEAEKNQMSRDLASQTQRLVESKLTIQRLQDQNRNLQSDLNLSINLLRNRPNCFVSQRVDSLPADVRAGVKNYAAEKSRERSEGKKIRVAIPDDVTSSAGAYSSASCDLEGGGGDMVSAAILAKVLEERDKERRRDRKFCIDVGTQTHGWHFPAGKSAATSNQQPGSSSSTGSGATPSKCSSNSSPSSSPSSPTDSNHEKDQHRADKQVEHQIIDETDSSRELSKGSLMSIGGLSCQQQQQQISTRVLPRVNGNGNGAILFTSVIHTGVRHHSGSVEENRIAHSQSANLSLDLSQLETTADKRASSKLSLPLNPFMSRSVTCSTLQTDI